MTYGFLRDGESLVIREGEGRTAVCLELIVFGRDLILRIGGGERHAGAVAVSHRGGLGGEAATESITIPGHKEDALAREAARAIAEASGRTCVVVAGIHQDNASREEIAGITGNVTRAVAKMVERIS